jgi:Tol biopolymer transport system component
MSAVNGSGIVQVVDGPGYTDTDPEWSPDGTRIVFETNRNILGGGNQYDIYVVDVNGANPVNLTPGISASDSDPIWSPDGSKIAFTSSRDGDPEVFVMNADGSGLTQLTKNGSATDVPGSFSPDGQFLAFVSDRENPGNFDIWVMAATGGRATRVVKHAAQDRSVVWRP